MRQRLTDGHPDNVLLLYVGRLAPEKRLHLLKPLLERVSGTRLALIGDGPHRGYLEELFTGLPVVFAGYCQGEELAAAYASSDIFVFTSSHESFGLVLAEAIASGLPVLSSRVGGAEDIIRHGETGYIFDVDNPGRLEEYVHELVANPEKRRQMGQQARRYSESLKWDEIMRELIYFYEDIIREKGGDPRFSAHDRRKSTLLEPAPPP
jgi:glycosyltransferase involved in cell wall biosynthesis